MLIQGAWLGHENGSLQCGSFRGSQHKDTDQNNFRIKHSQRIWRWCNLEQVIPVSSSQAPMAQLSCHPGVHCGAHMPDWWWEVEDDNGSLSTSWENVSHKGGGSDVKDDLVLKIMFEYATWCLANSKCYLMSSKPFIQHIIICNLHLLARLKFPLVKFFYSFNFQPAS